mmetsp:Transcript_25550/g.101847  ORF Transcript_25550/g.101847 Transcript_25550/m.101847 type:complete len:106 (+) Transcript_25550:242-559(+)
MPRVLAILPAVATLATVAHARGGGVLTPHTKPVIPLFPRELASSSGLELEVVADDTEPRTIYSGEATCYVSAHGQRSAACARFDRASREVFDADEVARHHPLHEV